MPNPIDDAFNAAESEAAAKRREQAAQQQEAKIYEEQVDSLVRNLIDAVHARATEFNEHPKNTEKATIPVVGAWPFRIRRASASGAPDRIVEINFRRDLGRLAWRYEASPNAVYAPYEQIASAEHRFGVQNQELGLQGVDTPQQFADMVLGQFIRDCANDSVRRAAR